MKKLFRRCDDLADIARSVRRIAWALWRIVRWLEASNTGARFQWGVGPVVRKEGQKMPLTITSTNEEKVKITAVPVTSTGQPAQIDDEIRVSVISGDGTVEPVDQLSFYVVSPDSPGDTTYLVEADADLGDGVVLIQDTITYTATGALATALGLVAGTPEPK